MDIEKEKIKLAKKLGLNKIPKNTEFAAYFKNKNMQQILKTKPVRTGSGVAVIAVAFIPEHGFCPGSCIYCPRGENAPQSYTGDEPSMLRGIRNNYDTKKQVDNRIKQLHIIGHETDKCELIIMGGTFPSLPFEEQKKIIKSCFDVLNECESRTLEEAQKVNETAKNRCVGLTIETRPDYCGQEEISRMLFLGCTRVEIGVQCLDDRILEKISRGHGIKEIKNAFRLLRNNGLKITAHMMPGLTGIEKLDMKKEMEQFRILFNDPGLMPDELKIYPVLVIPGTKLYDLWKKGKYQTMSKEQAIELIKCIKKIVPEYVRIKRIMRDIPEQNVAAGPATTNLRQLINAECRCIRCREPKDFSEEGILKITEYSSDRSREFFLSFETRKYIYGFLRLSLGDRAIVRELHVYGPMAGIGAKGKLQHKGYGTRLLKQAESIVKSNGYNDIFITSGIGAREYYRKHEYALDSCYMKKTLENFN